MARGEAYSNSPLPPVSGGRLRRSNDKEQVKDVTVDATVVPPKSLLAGGRDVPGTLESSLSGLIEANQLTLLPREGGQVA